MLAHQQKIQFSSYSGLYALIVPKDNLLRKINDLIDFSFIYDELLEQYIQNNGRTAESPIRMFRYLLLKTIFTVSDVDVVDRSRYDISFKYFLEMSPEAEVIDPGSLTRFRKLRLKDMDLLNLLIGKTVSLALEKGIIKSKSIIVDATHSVSIKSDLHKEQMAFQETEYYKEKIKERYKIEAKNSELKNVHGYKRAISYGIENMEMQGALAIFTVNLKRILKLIN